MKVADILSFIDTGVVALPEFQRGYVWNRDQVRRLLLSLYQGHPIGSLLIWVTMKGAAKERGDGPAGYGTVEAPRWPATDHKPLRRHLRQGPCLLPG